MKAKEFINIACSLIILFTIVTAWGEDVSKENIEAEITIDLNYAIGSVNYAVLGNTTLGYTERPHYGERECEWGINPYHIDGSGVWNPDNRLSNKQILTMTRNIGISIIRFPGGCGVHGYNWKDTVGPEQLRPPIYSMYVYNETGEQEYYQDPKSKTWCPKLKPTPVRFGLPEFLLNALDLGATPVITVSDYTGTASDAADMVRYLNAPCPDCPDPDPQVCTKAYKENKWEQLRICDGLPKDGLNIQWFEYGNESYHGPSVKYGDGFGTAYSPNEYADTYLKYREAMKTVDARIKLGAVLNVPEIPFHLLHTRTKELEWTELVISAVGHVADFFIVHNYVMHYRKNCCAENDKKCRSNKPGVPICAMDTDTIYKIALAGSNDQLYDYYQTLSDLIIKLSGRKVPIANTEFNVAVHPYRHSLGNALVNADHIRQLMLADNINFATHFHLANSYYGMIVSNEQSYIARPNYYVYEFYNNYFGDLLLNAQVNSPFYEIEPRNHKGYWKIVESKTITVEPLTRYKIEGYVKTQDLRTSGDGVSIAVSDDRSFKIQIPGAVKESKGDWKYISREFRTTADTSSVTISLIRADNSLINGIVWWDDIKLLKVTSGDVIFNADFENYSSNWKLLKNKSLRLYTSIDMDENHTNSGNKAARAHFISPEKYKVMSAYGRKQDELVEDNLLSRKWSVTPLKTVVTNVDNDTLTLNISNLYSDYANAKIMVNVGSEGTSSWYRLSGKINTIGLTQSSRAYLSVGSGVNMLSDSGFERGLDTWRHKQDPSGAHTVVETDPEHIRNGEKSMKVIFGEPQNQTHKGYDVNYWHTNQYVMVKPNTTYAIEGYIKTDIDTSGSGATIAVADGRGRPYGSWSTNHVTGHKNWTYVGKEFTTSPETQSVQVFLRRFGGGGRKITGTAWWDDVTLTHKSTTRKVAGSAIGALNGWHYIFTDISSTSDSLEAVANINSFDRISGAVQYRDIKLQKITTGHYGAVPYLSVNASKSLDGKKVFLMVINKHMDRDIIAGINLKGFKPISARARILNGDSVVTENNIINNEVITNVNVSTINIAPFRNHFPFTFPAHSLTSIEILK